MINGKSLKNIKIMIVNIFENCGYKNLLIILYLQENNRIYILLHIRAYAGAYTHTPHASYHYSHHIALFYHVTLLLF